MIKVYSDEQRLYLLCDASHNIPVILADVKKPEKAIKEMVRVILSISLDTFSTQKSKQVWNQLSEMEQISMERSGMDICSISGAA